MANTTTDLHLVILAAGKGTRMRTRRAKLLHRLGGLTIIDRGVRIARGLSPASITLVVGHQADEVRASLSQQDDLQFVVQEPQLGTGHAVADRASAGRTGTMVLPGRCYMRRRDRGTTTRPSTATPHRRDRPAFTATAAS
jgi:bifunctional UDP-N-acetylglucosamine pyrophosphorylase/glucosamine-1-phosphate N-acetyltransferase